MRRILQVGSADYGDLGSSFEPTRSSLFVRGSGIASGQKLNALKLVLKVQADAGINARNHPPGEGKSVASETASEEWTIDSDTTGTLEGCIAG